MKSFHRWLARGPARRATRRELFLIAVLLVLCGSLTRVETSTGLVATPGGATLQEVLVRAARDADDMDPPEWHVDVTGCSLEIQGQSRVATFMGTRLGVFASVEMTLLAPRRDPLASAALSDGDRAAIERFFAAYLPCARTSLGARTRLDRPGGQLRVAHRPRAGHQWGAVAVARATGGDIWLGPYATPLKVGMWFGWLFLALSAYWLFIRAARAIVSGRQRERLRLGLCPTCTYDIRDGGLALCPECGTDPATAAAELARQPE